MSETMNQISTNFPGFSEFFRAVWGRDPFPWQTALANSLMETGEWPGTLDLPTGTGKTTAVDIAVWHLARTASLALASPSESLRVAPRRIVYVVDRRTIVDQAYDRARKIAEALATADSNVLKVVANALRDIAGTDRGDAHPLQVALLRGAVPRDDAWSRSPAQPLVIVSTVDQVGSRLLFRGYGVSDGMKPVHAGLLGNDVVMLLDEVHLSQPFCQTLNSIAGRYRHWHTDSTGTALTIVQMSATSHEQGGTRFNLGEDDRVHPVLRKRLENSKKVTLREAKNVAFVSECVKAVLDAPPSNGEVHAVVVNRVQTARELAAALREHKKVDADIILLTGRMRGYDRDIRGAEIAGIAASGRERLPTSRACIVVATQCIEAGADFDFDRLVTECASIDALKQRFGRLDRLGERGETEGVIILRTESLKDDPVYGAGLTNTWNKLVGLQESGGIDFGCGRIELDPEQLTLCSAPRENAPVLLPAHLDLWSQTAPLPDQEPDVSLWLHGQKRGPADVQIIWRADVKESLLKAAEALLSNGDKQAKTVVARIQETIGAVPPVSSEAISVSFTAARCWLAGLSEEPQFDVEGADEDIDVGTDKRPVEPRLAWRWQGNRSELVTAFATRRNDRAEVEGRGGHVLNHLRPGDTIVVPASYGGLDDMTWSPSSRTPVVDIADIAASRQRGRLTLRLYQRVFEQFTNSADDSNRAWVRPWPPATDEDNAQSLRKHLAEWLKKQAGALPESAPETTPGAVYFPFFKFLCGRLLAAWKGCSLNVVNYREEDDDSPAGHVVVTSRRLSAQMLRELQPGGSAGSSAEQSTMAGGGSTDASSLLGARVSLKQHTADVVRQVDCFVDALGISTAHAKALRQSAEYHDIGKVDPRFQALLYGSTLESEANQDFPLAKSASPAVSDAEREQLRLKSGYPAKARHELASLALLNASGQFAVQNAETELTLHLIGSHHGHCRPFAPFADDGAPVQLRYVIGGIEVTCSSAHELHAVDSPVAERFWKLQRTFGWWGLAWYEAVFRLADHRASELEQLPATEGA